MSEQAVASLLAEEFAGEWGFDGPMQGLVQCEVLRATNMTGRGVDYRASARRFIPARKAEVKKLVQGDVMLEGAGGGPGVPVGRVARFDPPDDRTYLVSNFFRTLRPAPTTDPRFVHHVLADLYRQSRIWTVQQQTTGIINLKLKDYLRLLVEVPPVDEQRRIAEILDTIDETIQAAERVIAKQVSFYEGLASALLRGERTGGERRSVPTGWVVGRLPSLDGLPGTWQVANLSQLVGLESGHTPARNVPTYWDGAIPWLSLHDTTRLDFDVIGETTLTVSELGIQNSSARILPAGTTALSRTATVGKAVEFARPMATSQDFACFPPSKQIAPSFLLHLFRHMAPVWRGLAAGSTHQTIYMPTFKRLEIALPPIEEQQSIVESLEAVRTVIICERIVRGRLAQTRSGLAADLLSGRVRTAVS